MEQRDDDRPEKTRRLSDVHFVPGVWKNATPEQAKNSTHKNENVQS
jgi:hypothetical protein